MRRENITQGRIIAKFNELIGAIVTHYECYHFVCKHLQCSVCGIIFQATGGRWGTHLRARERRDWQRADDVVCARPDWQRADDAVVRGAVGNERMTLFVRMPDWHWRRQNACVRTIVHLRYSTCTHAVFSLHSSLLALKRLHCGDY